MAKKAIKKTVKKSAAKATAKKAPLFPGFFKDKLGKADPKIAKAIQSELHRQQHEIELIASENIVSRAVLEAQGSVLTNKYAEGYPGRRYYGGCQYVDEPSTGDRPRQEALQLSLRQCAAAFRRPGQPGRVLRAHAAGRYLHGPRPRAAGI